MFSLAKRDKQSAAALAALQRGMYEAVKSSQDDEYKKALRELFEKMAKNTQLLNLDTLQKNIVQLKEKIANYEGTLVEQLPLVAEAEEARQKVKEEGDRREAERQRLEEEYRLEQLKPKVQITYEMPVGDQTKEIHIDADNDQALFNKFHLAAAKQELDGLKITEELQDAMRALFVDFILAKEPYYSAPKPVKQWYKKLVEFHEDYKKSPTRANLSSAFEAASQVRSGYKSDASGQSFFQFPEFVKNSKSWNMKKRKQ